MKNEELIKALQCSGHFALYQDCYEKNCYANSGKGLYCNIPKLMRDAADALEATDSLLAQNTERCEGLRKQLRDAHENYEKHLNELEAQFPNHGEWIEADDLEGAIKGRVVCSNCGGQYQSLIMRNNEIEIRANKTPYCPNCGAKMDGEVKNDD